MSIVIDETSRVVVQGITGRMSQLHVEEMLAYGTKIVAGVTPGRGDQHVQGIPVFDTMVEAVSETAADTSIIFGPPPFAADAIMEAVAAGIRVCVCITDGIPVQDMMAVKRYMRTFPKQARMTLIGPNCAGVISPGKSLVGIMPASIFLPGRVGIIGRSGTLGYEAASQLQAAGIGISTSVGIGGDPINGSSFKDHLEAFEQDPDTDVVVLIGEIGGPQEADAGRHVRDTMSKPVVAYIAGLTAPRGRTMGHAGAIVNTAGESAAEKVALLRECGVAIVERPADFAEVVSGVLSLGV